MSKKKKDLFDNVMETGLVGIGTVGATGIVGSINKNVPSTTSNKIMKGMEPMVIIPTMSATGGVFGQLQNLNKKVKKRK